MSSSTKSNIRQIYLASNSKARKEILKIFGIKFKVIPADVEEKIYKGLPYSLIVKRNALSKAKKIAGRIKNGVIIGADTIVVQGEKIFGKPRNLKDARLMLKKLSGKPQWLYTGLAVIDKEAKRALVDYEKTKIYMDRLSDKEITEYFSKVSPFDKAGSFDIQGRGAFFIRRIEGCFYNVVGLPVHKLYKMLKKMNIKVFVFAAFVFFSSVLFLGCSTEYNIVTGQEESYYISTDREVRMGESIDKQVLEEYKLADDLLVQKRVSDIGKKIAAVCDRKEIDYHFRVLGEEEVNAVSLPGGYVYIFKGLVDKVANDDELACVIGHEVGHIVARHSVKKLQADQLYTILQAVAAGASRSGQVAGAVDAAFTQLMLGYSREDELLADELGTRYAKLAGYNPQAMITFLEKLQDINRRSPLRPMNYFKTHPYVPDRIRVVRQELGEQARFNDYINIEQKQHGRE